MITLSLPQLPVKDDLSGRVQTNFDLTTIAFNRLQSGIDGLQTSVAAFSLANSIIKNPSTSARNTIKSSAIDATTLTLKAFASQTASLQEWQNSSGTVKISVTPAGNLGIGITPVYGLDAETVVGSTVAKFGASTPLYIRASDPGLGFNAYYNSGWKFGKGSSSNYAANFDFDPTTGNLVYSATSASGNADAAATMASLLTITKAGNVSIAGTENVVGNFSVNTNKFTISASTGDFNSAALAGSGTVVAQITSSGGFVRSSLDASIITTGIGSPNCIAFWTGTEVLSYDTLYWDPTNHRLGIGVASPAVALDISGAINVSSGDLKILSVGNGIYVKEGTNATAGSATLSGGTITINTTKITTASHIILGVGSGTLTNIGTYKETARIAGTSFTITSTNVLDASTFAWWILEPA